MASDDHDDEAELGEAVRRGAPSLPAEAWSALEAVESAVLGELEATRTLGGRYVLGPRIGAGGLGVVHRGHDRELDRDVAIKLVRRSGRDAKSIALQVHEARMLARARHPDIVEVFDIVDDADSEQVCIVMELVDGVDLRRWIRAAPRTSSEIVGVLALAGRALAAAHALGVVHCDFKPSNVMIQSDTRSGTPRVRVLDFGLARGISAPADERTKDGRSRSTERSSTIEGIGGTPGYMAPEQRRGVVTPAVDQYAFCIALYECAVGTMPPDTLDAPPSRSALLALHRSLRGVIARGTSPDPARRFASMDALLAALPRPGGRSMAMPLGGLAVLLVAGAAWSARSDANACALDSVRAWDDDVRGRVAARLEHLVGAAAARDADAAFTERWHALDERWSQACTTHDVRTDARFTCLRRQRARFAELAQAIAEAEANAAFGAASELARDPGLAECDAPDPDDPDLAPGPHAELLDRLAEADALAAAGNGARALALATEIRQEATGIEDTGVVARASLLEGRAASSLGRLDDALLALERAVPAAHASGDDRVAVMAAATLCTATAMANRPDDAEHWCDAAQSSLARGADDPVLRGNVERAWSALAFARWQPEVAREHIDLAIAAWRGSDRQDELARDLGNAAKLATMDNRLDDARVLVGEAIAIERALAVLEGPQLAGRLHVSCGIEYNAGNHELALRHCMDAWAIVEHTVPRHSNVVVGIALVSSHVLAELGRWAESARFARIAIAGIEEAHGPDDPDLALPLGQLGVALAHGTARERDEAEAAAHRAVVLAEAGFPGEHPTLASVVADLGVVLHLQGHLEEAEVMLRRSLAIIEALRGPTHVDTVRASRRLAEVEVDRGDCADARPRLVRAVAALEANPIDGPHELPRTRTLLARCP